MKKQKSGKMPMGYKFQGSPTPMFSKSVSSGKIRSKGMGRTHGNGRSQARAGC